MRIRTVRACMLILRSSRDRFSAVLRPDRNTDLPELRAGTDHGQAAALKGRMHVIGKALIRHAGGAAKALQGPGAPHATVTGTPLMGPRIL